MGDVLADGLEDWKGALEIGFGAASHDGEVSGFCADLAAGDGRVDPVDSGGEGLGFGDACGAEVDDEGVGVQAFDEATGAEDDLVDDIGHGEVDADDARADCASEIGKGGGALHAEGDGGNGGGVTAIPDGDFGTGGVEVAGVGAAHVAEADKADFLSAQGMVHEMS